MVGAAPAKAFSSEMCSGSHEENASKLKDLSRWVAQMPRIVTVKSVQFSLGISLGIGHAGPNRQKTRGLEMALVPPKTAALYVPMQQKEPYQGVKAERDVKYGPDDRQQVLIAGFGCRPSRAALRTATSSDNGEAVARG